MSLASILIHHRMNATTSGFFNQSSFLMATTTPTTASLMGIKQPTRRKRSLRNLVHRVGQPLPVKLQHPGSDKLVGETLDIQSHHLLMLTSAMRTGVA